MNGGEEGWGVCGDGRVTGRRVERAADSHANEGVKSIPPTQQPGGWTAEGNRRHTVRPPSTRLACPGEGAAHK